MAKKSLPTYKDLWDRYYTVKMLYLHSRSVEQVRRFGVRISGVDEIDRYLDRQEITTQLNIDSMFEKHRQGVTIRVLRYEDTSEIYNVIHSHLIAWAEYLSTGVNIGNAPLKDLIELDAFAAVVYDKAKSVFSKEEKVSALASNFTNVQTINFKNILAREVKETETRMTPSGLEVVTINNDKPFFPDRESMKEVFTDQINRIQGWRTNV